MRTDRFIIIAVIVATQLVANLGQAEETSETIKALLKRIEELEKKVERLELERKPAFDQGGAGDKVKIDTLDQKVRILERNRELDTEAAEAKAKEALKISVDERGFAVGSPDGNNLIKLRGLLQVDSRFFFNDGGNKNNDSFVLRRARPIFEGTVFRDFDFQFVPEFGGSTPQILEANINYRYSPELQLRVGKFKSPVGLEQLQADARAGFIERALPTNLTPDRDLGVMLNGEVSGGVFNYAAGIFNGVGDNRKSTNLDIDDDKEFAGRIFLHPFRRTENFLQGLGVGISGSYGSAHGAAGLPLVGSAGLPGFSTDGVQQFFAYNPSGGAVTIADGNHWRLSPQAYFYYGPFGLLGEYVISSQKVSRTVKAPFVFGRIDNTAWQIAGSYVLTGEDASYTGVTPRKPFNPTSGDWGAFELTARYAALDIDSDAFPDFADPTTSASSANSWTVGLNWWLNKNIRTTVSFSRATFSGGGGDGTTAPAIITRQPENVVQTRFQVAF